MNLEDKPSSISLKKTTYLKNPRKMRGMVVVIHITPDARFNKRGWEE